MSIELDSSASIVILAAGRALRIVSYPGLSRDQRQKQRVIFV